MAVFRDDRDALAALNDELRLENERLRAERDAMGEALRKHRIDIGKDYARGSVYEGSPTDLSEGERAALSQNELTKFPVWAAIVLHLVTFGMFSIVHFARLHAKLPRLREDDPSFGKALGMMFVPYVNIWWMFFSSMRLVDRLRLQYLVRGREPPLTKSSIVAGGTLWFITYFLPFAWIAAVWKVQHAVNDLVEMGPYVPNAGASSPRIRVGVDGTGASDAGSDSGEAPGDATPVEKRFTSG